MEICPECEGAGRLVLIGHNGKALYRESYNCPMCHGAGMIQAPTVDAHKHEALPPEPKSA